MTSIGESCFLTGRLKRSPGIRAKMYSDGIATWYSDLLSAGTNVPFADSPLSRLDTTLIQ